MFEFLERGVVKVCPTAIMMFDDNSLMKVVFQPNRFEVLGGLTAIPEGLGRLQSNQGSGEKPIAHPQD